MNRLLFLLRRPCPLGPQGCQLVEHTVQIARRPEEVWSALHSIYDDLLTYQVLICPNTQPLVTQTQVTGRC